MNDTSSPTAPVTALKWRDTLKVYGQPASLRMLALGFAAGLPLLLVLGTLSFRLREAGIDRSTIGYLSWVGLAYGFKWVWAPLVDRLPLPGLTPWLGRRRSWLLVSQLAIMAGLAGMALDAFRIESADARLQAALAASYQTGYRLAMIWAGAGVLWIAAHQEAVDQSGYQQAAWQAAYLVMAASMVVGLVTVAFSNEPAPVAFAPARNVGEWLQSAVVAPFADFWVRHRWHAVLVLSLIAVYRISDVVMGIMANPFYVDMGYTKDEVAAVTKVYGVVMTLLGAFIGGAMALRWGVMRVLMIGAVLSALSNLLFAWLGQHGHDVTALIWVISADNLSSGIASAAFIAYLSSLTNVQYSATQYALFSSLMLLLPKFVAGFSGQFVDTWGYEAFFIGTALLGLPVLVLVWLAGRAQRGGEGTPPKTPNHSPVPF